MLRAVVHACDGECIAHLGSVSQPWENIPGCYLLETECTCEEAEAIEGVQCAHDADMVFEETASQIIHLTDDVSTAPSGNIGLAMISSPERLPNIWPADFEYAYDTTGAGVLAYQVDSKTADNPTFSGNANDLAGRVEVIYDAHNAGPSDHGCAVAGILAGKVYGVAKGALIKNAAATNGTGTLSQIIGAFNAIIGHYAGRSEPAVINASIAGSGSSNPLAGVVSACRDAGLLIVAGNGNGGVDGSTTWPAADPRCVSVGAMYWQEGISPFSNHGPAIDLFALGEYVRVDGWNINGRLSGASAASPFVAGIAARLLEGRARLGAAGVDALKAEIIAMAKDGRAGVPASTTQRVAYIPGAVAPSISDAQIRVSILA